MPVIGRNAREHAWVFLLILAASTLVWPRIDAFRRGFDPQPEIFNRWLDALTEVDRALDLVLPGDTPVLFVDVLPRHRTQRARYSAVSAALAPRRVISERDPDRQDPARQPRLVLVWREDADRLADHPLLRDARVVAELPRGAVLLERRDGCSDCPP